MAVQINSQFKIIGVLSYKDKPKLVETVSKNNPLWKSYSLSFGVKVDGGFHYLRLNGGDMYLDTNHTNIDKFTYFNKEGTMISLTENQVNTPEVLETIPFYKKKRFHDTEFVYNRDFIKAIYDNIEALNGKLVYISGNIEFQYSKDKDIIYKTFVPTTIKLASQQDTKEICTGDFQLFFDEDAIDPNVFSKDKFNISYIQDLGNKIVIKGYVAQYNSDKLTRESVPYLYYPLEFNIKTDKIDFDNPDHVRVLKFMINQCIASKNKIVSSGWVVKFKRGNVEIDLTEEQKKSMLTKEELEYLALFPDAEEEFLKKKLQMTSERVDEIWLTRPHPSLPIKEVQEDVSSDMLLLYKEIGGYGNNSKKQSDDVEESPTDKGVDFSMFD